jgi:hypothetical protein
MAGGYQLATGRCGRPNKPLMTGTTTSWTRSALTAVNKHKGLQQFYKYVEDEEKISRHPMRRMPQPKKMEKLIPVVLDDAGSPCCHVQRQIVPGPARYRDHPAAARPGCPVDRDRPCSTSMT